MLRQTMQIETTEIDGLKILTPRRFEDARGYFSETFKQRALADAGIAVSFIQDNQSLSRVTGTIRGLHFQSPPFAQAKLVRVLVGEILDVAVDLRKDSPTFGHHVAVELSAENGRQLLVPEGFAHGFITRAPDTVVFYKVSAPYAPGHEGGIRWDDPQIKIDWGLNNVEPSLSEKDRQLPTLAQLDGPAL
jgi:dTDP-4-dehydrorhamnose 3,5-epimerase